MRHTTATFIKAARETHGSKYLYSKSIYEGANKTLVITCRKHGPFRQRASAHVSGQGCPGCAVQAATAIKMTTKEFIAKAKTRHGTKFLYTEATYTGAHNPVTITCRVHGNFFQVATRHLLGAECPQCGRQRTQRTVYLQEFPAGASVLTRRKTFELSDKVDLNCDVHGTFSIRVSRLIHRKVACLKCAQAQAAEKIRKPFKTYVAQANKVHDNKYRYLRYESKPVLSIVAVCPIHGEFKQRVQGHLVGGCFSCGKIKQLKSGYTVKEYKLGKRIVKVQGYEDLALDILRETTRISAIRLGTDIPVFKYTDPTTKKRRTYYPDIYIKSTNTVVEVKSLYYFLRHGRETFYENATKAQAVVASGFKFELMVFDKQQERLKVPKRWYDMTYTELRRLLC